LTGSQPSHRAVPRGALRTADLLGALALAADLAVGLPAEHAARSCYMGMRIAERLQLPAGERASVYYAELLMDAGCTAWTSQLATAILSDEVVARRQFVYFNDAHSQRKVAGWLGNFVAPNEPPLARTRYILDFALHGRGFVREGFRNTCEVAQRFAARLLMPVEVQNALLSVFEQWDGRGPHGARGELIPLCSRIVYTTSLLEAVHRAAGPAAAVRLARRGRGKSFDPLVVDAFMALAGGPDFWQPLARESIWETVLQLEPESTLRYFPPEGLEAIALSFADFVDLKSRYLMGHSRRTGELATRIATQLQLPAGEVATIRQAALIHDLGLVTVPSFALERPEATRTRLEQEQMRLHPYLAERILARVPAFAAALPLVSAHHERPDGTGYYRGLRAAQIPLGARVIAVADGFDDLTHESADRPALDSVAALRRMSDEVETAYCPRAFQALVQTLHVAQPLPPIKPPAHDWPASLTDREIEILRLLARGESRRQIAVRLVISEHTVRHHLEHIYEKVGVKTRVAATLFALENNLLR
jgi:HD-GYP domain-containing protein (c-di-GMP phosphodiesterase class II)/DNA-binding CsgD family transcriptional regulator